MNNKNDGGAAFSQLKELRTNDGRTVIYEANYEASGMTIRQYYKAAALQGLLAQSPRKEYPSVFVEEASALADAMLAEDKEYAGSPTGSVQNSGEGRG